jgi:hypothetical protein
MKLAHNHEPILARFRDRGTDRAARIEAFVQNRDGDVGGLVQAYGIKA